MATVLVVDDSPTDRLLAGGLLEKRPEWRVTYAADGKEALALLEEDAPDIVLTDLQMPEMNGLELVEAVTRDYPLVPVILMTAKGSEEIAVEALRRGAASYVPKKNLARDLFETLDHVQAAVHRDLSLARVLLRMTGSQLSFSLHNDPALFPPLVSYLQRALTDMHICNDSDCLRVGVAIEEALLNACYHGNLEISFQQCDQDQQSHYDVARERRLESPFRERRVHVRAEFSRNEAVFVIRDDGAGFDPATLPDPTLPANLEWPYGRGVLLMRTFMDELRFNAAGNEVTLTKRRSTSGNNVVPSAILREIERLSVEQINDVTVVRLDANMADESYAGEAVQELYDLVELGRPAKLLLNLSDLQHIHSFALGRLRDLNDKVRQHNGRLRLCELQPTVAEVFHVTRIREAFDIHPDEQSALQDWT